MKELLTYVFSAVCGLPLGTVNLMEVRMRVVTTVAAMAVVSVNICCKLILHLGSSWQEFKM